MKKPETIKLNLRGHAGSLEAVLSIPEQSSSTIAVVCHPHPLYGGTMDNKVVHYTAKALLEMGVTVLRFNFRGVGNSAGKHDNANGEVDDCLVAIEWMHEQYPGQQLVIAGFSFGAYIATQAASRSDVHALITIAPAVQLYDFSAIDVSCPWLLIQGDEDEVVPANLVASWASQHSQLSKVVWVEGASHFFHGRLLDLSKTIQGWIREILW
jgi:alpha/beta superfamily hydrolase